MISLVAELWRRLGEVNCNFDDVAYKVNIVVFVDVVSESSEAYASPKTRERYAGHFYFLLG